jgi:SAM-dependent methyltransferase
MAETRLRKNQDRDYVLGTDDEEIARLGVQHDVWRQRVHECFDRAGLETGDRVIDVGAGPGYATLDLARRVGPEGEVIAVERSERFVTHGTAQCMLRDFKHVQFVERDVLEALPAMECDASWCRWVASFVKSPEALVQNIAAALNPGGVAMFHEYANYATWRMAPRRPLQEEFVQHVMASWRDAGGEPDVALGLPTLLEKHGFRIRHVEPIVWSLAPKDPAWRWLASFLETGTQRLLELGRVDKAWIERLHAELRDAEKTPALRMFTPMVLEIVAEKR